MLNREDLTQAMSMTTASIHIKNKQNIAQAGKVRDNQSLPFSL